MNIGYTFQKFHEAITVLTGPEDSTERLSKAIALLGEARRRGVRVGFDDPDLDQRFERVLQGEPAETGAAIGEIVSLAMQAFRIETEFEDGVIARNTDDEGKGGA